MSLINQVLRDLDKRHAAAGAVPGAVRSAPLSRPASRRGRALGVAALSLAAVGGAAAALAWSLGSRTAVPVVAAAPVAASAPVSAPAPAPTPVVIVAAPAPAASAAPAVAVPAPAASVAVAANAAPAADDAWPARTLAKAPSAAIAPPAALPAAQPLAAEPPVLPPPAEPRIDKRAPVRTAQERAEAAYQRGVAAHQPGQWNDAAAAYAVALREDARHASARQALAGVLVAQGRADDAKALLAEGQALAPQHAGLALMLARLCAEQGELPRAAEVLQPLMHAWMAPEDRAFHAAVLQRLNRHAEAAELFAAAVRVTPGNGVWWMGLGMSLAADGRNDVAREAFQRARASGGLSPELAGYVEQRLRQL